MKKSNKKIIWWILGGVVLVAGYLIFTGKKVSAMVPKAFRQGVDRAQQNLSESFKQATGMSLPSTNKEALEVVNDRVRNRERLERTSETILKPADRVRTIESDDGRTFRIPKNTGVAQLADGSVKAIRVKAVERDEQGLSEWDKRIINNARKAKARGESISIGDRLRAFV